jgi:Predicted membrane protein (DUF2127)
MFPAAAHFRERPPFTRLGDLPPGPPPSAVYALIGLGVLGLVGALGLWMLKRWALWLTVVVCVLNILAAALEVGLRIEHRLASLGDYRGSGLHPYLGRIVLWKFAYL